MYIYIRKEIKGRENEGKKEGREEGKREARKQGRNIHIYIYIYIPVVFFLIGENGAVARTASLKK
jgi:hypothetical protein